MVSSRLRLLLPQMEMPSLECYLIGIWMSQLTISENVSVFPAGIRTQISGSFGQTLQIGCVHLLLHARAQGMRCRMF
jgi:hypothetical protein